MLKLHCFRTTKFSVEIISRSPITWNRNTKLFVKIEHTMSFSFIQKSTVKMVFDIVTHTAKSDTRLWQRYKNWSTTNRNTY